MESTETPQQNTGGTEQASGSGKVNLNTAGKEELMTLSGIGESRADAIIAYREANGLSRFRTRRRRNGKESSCS